MKTYNAMEAMEAFEAGKAHWDGVIQGTVEPVMPPEYEAMDRLLQNMFVKGAIEVMNQTPLFSN